MIKLSVRQQRKPVNLRTSRSEAAPRISPASTSLVQCASNTIRVATNPAPASHTRFRRPFGRQQAAEANAPTWTACPEGKASRAFPKWKTPNGKANFTIPKAALKPPPEDEEVFELMMMRADGQFNTTIYNEDDRFRGIHGGRYVVFINPEDMARMRRKQGDLVTLSTDADDGIERKLSELQVVPYDIPRKSIAGYYPECNVLIRYGILPKGAKCRRPNRCRCAYRKTLRWSISRPKRFRFRQSRTYKVGLARRTCPAEPIGALLAV
jgi:anaerobic selenocysteine-containing dehydrogenase